MTGSNNDCTLPANNRRARIYEKLGSNWGFRLRLSPSKGKRCGIWRLSAPFVADPVIDRDGTIYVGTHAGMMHAFEPGGVEMGIADVGSQSSLGIGPDASRVVVREDAIIGLVR